VLEKLNNGSAHSFDLSSDALLRVISELFDEEDFLKREVDRQAALESLNKLVAREGLVGYFDDDRCCYVRNTGTGTKSSALPQLPRPLSKKEIVGSAKIAK
jgi:hypothetical protein